MGMGEERLVGGQRRQVARWGGNGGGGQGGHILGSRDRKGRLWDGRLAPREGFCMGGAELGGPARAQPSSLIQSQWPSNYLL